MLRDERPVTTKARFCCIKAIESFLLSPSCLVLYCICRGSQGSVHRVPEHCHQGRDLPPPLLQIFAAALRLQRIGCIF